MAVWNPRTSSRLHMLSFALSRWENEGGAVRFRLTVGAPERLHHLQQDAAPRSGASRPGDGAFIQAGAPRT